MNNISNRTLSLKDNCVNQIETMILSGEFPIATKLPPERDLAKRLGVSRPVAHEALVELSTRGLVTISPRHGVEVNDYQKTGSLSLLDSLVSYREGTLEESLRSDLFAFRKLIEGETARLAALNRTSSQWLEFLGLLDQESAADCSDARALTEIDFSFHLLVARASGNAVYPLILNSFKNAYTSYTRAFFLAHICSPVIQEVFTYHLQLAESIHHKRSREAGLIMIQMLTHGEENWKGE
jgi:DNA-binding FadR family transcriptional regulator